MTEKLYIVQTKHKAEECPGAFEDWERLKRNQRLPVVGGLGYCHCPFDDHSGFVIVADEAAAREVVRTYRTGKSSYRPIESFPFAAQGEPAA